MMVEKSKPITTAEKQETLSKRPGKEKVQLTLIFHDELKLLTFMIH